MIYKIFENILYEVVCGGKDDGILIGESRELTYRKVRHNVMVMKFKSDINGAE